MSWFNKFLKIFNSDETDGHVEDERNVPNHHEKINGNIETKMTYQYPKGNFRFPIIPDVGNDLPPKEEVLETKKINNTKKKHVVEKPAPRKQQELIQPKIKQPFRATDIPSPVFGFNRPLKKSHKTFEFELTSNEKAQQKEVHLFEEEFTPVNKLDPQIDMNNDDNFVDQRSIQKQEEEQDFKKSIDNEWSDDKRDVDNEIQQDRSIQNEVEEEVKETFKSEEWIEEEEQDHTQLIGNECLDDEREINDEQQLHSIQNEVEEVKEAFKSEEWIEKEEQDLTQLIGNECLDDEKEINDEQQVHSIQNEVDDVRETFKSEEWIEEEEQDLTHLFGNECSDDEREVDDEIKQIRSIQDEGEEEEKETFKSEECVQEEKQDQNEEIISVGFIDKEDSPNELDFKVEPTQSISHMDLVKNEPKRSHIPFNVIMLKKDREKVSNNPINLEPESQKYNTQQIKTDVIEEYKEENYVFPSDRLLYPSVERELDKQWVITQSELLDETLINFNVRAKVVNVSQGPSVTRFEVQPEPGVKVNKITNLSDDIKLSLAAKDIRIEAPIPGKHTIGIELPNAQSRPVLISEIISSEIFQKSRSPLTAALGLDISGKPVITDLRKMPHGLIAGATGSGKSVCINSILVSLLYKATPDELRLLMIDPKMVELAPYNHIPHLVSPVITDVKAATAALKWAVDEMERRYELFAHTGVREIQRYNEMAEQNRQFNQKLPFIVIVIDELADLMMMAPADVEEAICRIAQKARACGIHLIIATQRPSVDVITGLIKANVPTRIAFSVSSQVDSRTIIDISGAEKLLGRGDMLFLENGTSKPIRLQGTYVSDEEIDKVVEHVRYERKPNYLFEQEELLKKAVIQDEEDEIFNAVCEFVMEQGAASTSLVQRNFRIGYNRAARLVEMMEQQGIISEARGSKPRDILISREEFDILSGTAEMKS
jgi:DNA segregation ATPase FtsK/SpoIIIE, S-DNA-T family